MNFYFKLNNIWIKMVLIINDSLYLIEMLKYIIKNWIPLYQTKKHKK